MRSRRGPGRSAWLCLPRPTLGTWVPAPGSGGARARTPHGGAPPAGTEGATTHPPSGGRRAPSAARRAATRALSRWTCPHFVVALEAGRQDWNASRQCHMRRWAHRPGCGAALEECHISHVILSTVALPPGPPWKPPATPANVECRPESRTTFEFSNTGLLHVLDRPDYGRWRRPGRGTQRPPCYNPGPKPRVVSDPPSALLASSFF